MNGDSAPHPDYRNTFQKGRCTMIGLVLLGLLLTLGIMSILGWTFDSRDDTQKLWPLEGTRPQQPPPVPARRDELTPPDSSPPGERDADRHGTARAECRPALRRTGGSTARTKPGSRRVSGTCLS